MPLTPGTRLGPYEIVAPLGAGGMIRTQSAGIHERLGIALPLGADATLEPFALLSEDRDLTFALVHVDANVL